MLSVIAGAMLFTVSLYVGAGIRAYHRTRRKLFEELLSFNRIFGEEINYLKTPVRQIVKDFISDKNGELCKILTTFLTVLEKEVIYTADKIVAEIKNPYIKKEENKLIAEYLNTLGKSDAATQMVSIKHYGIKFEEAFSKAKEDAKVIGELSYKLGILIGIALMIIVV